MYEKILVPVDGSATSLTGLQEAIALARVMGMWWMKSRS